MDLIAVNDQVRDGSLGVGAVYCDAKSVAAPPRRIPALERLLNVMDIIVQQLDMGAGPCNANAQRTQPMFSRVEVANFKSCNPHVTPIVNGEHSLSSRRSETGGVEDRRFAGEALKSDKSIRRVSGNVNAHQLFIDPSSHFDRAARAPGISSMLNGAPWCSLSAGIGVI